MKISRVFRLFTVANDFPTFMAVDANITLCDYNICICVDIDNYYI